MIKIKKRIGDNFVEPERQLTEEEKLRVIASWGNESEYWFFEESDKDSQEWSDYQKYLTENVVVTNAADDTVNGLISQMSEEGLLKLAEKLKPILNQ